MSAETDTQRCGDPTCRTHSQCTYPDYTLCGHRQGATDGEPGADHGAEPGLERRYEVRKLDDPTGKHDACRYFVLDPAHDPIARKALRVYVIWSDDRALRRDLYTWLDDLKEADRD